MIKSILLAVDRSKHAEKALVVAADLAKKYQAELTIITAYRQNYAPRVMGEGMVAHVSTAAEEERQAAEIVAAAAVDAAQAAGAAIANSIVVQGDAATQILATAKSENADLIVLGSHGHGTFADLLVGSVSHKVMSHADCSCMIVR